MKQQLTVVMTVPFTTKLLNRNKGIGYNDVSGGYGSIGISTHYKVLHRAAVAQEVRAVVWQQEGCWFDPRAPPSSVSRCP